MPGILSIDNIAFVFFGYSMSYVELVGTILYLWSVWLISKRRILTWPVGIVSVILYMLLFYQIRLYSDFLEQIYYLGASIYGWVIWNKSGDDGQIQVVVYSNRQSLVFWIVITLVFSILVGTFMARIHVLLPEVFPEAASFPFLDALTTIMSFTAMWLMARKRIESWFYWIVVDVIGIWLYFVKDVKFIALLYVILLAMAFNGLRLWNQTRSKTSLAQPEYEN